MVYHGKMFGKMKALIFLAVISYGIAQEPEASTQCCPEGQILTRMRQPPGIGCSGDNATVKLSCTNGRWLLRDIIYYDGKVYERDTRNFIVQDPEDFCLVRAPSDFADPFSKVVPSAVICLVSESFEITGVLTLISVVFLLLTLAVYVYLPQMRDLQGLCYISMCLSMALGFLSLGILQLSPGFKGEICTTAGFLVYFWMMATFFWMNVISINTYRSINDATYLKKTERQQYFYYSCYAWGSTVFFLIFSICSNFIEGSHWNPGIGKNNNCWFTGTTETWIFFYGPIAVLVACNIFLFVVSSYILWQQTRKYEVDKLNKLKHKFLLSLKLFIVMGISWVFELTSFAHGESHIIWRITDTFNCLQGVVIFILLVLLRRRAIRGLASENCCLIITRRLAEKLSPHDDEDEQHVLADDTMEVRLN